jgi:hypothetical protein
MIFSASPWWKPFSPSLSSANRLIRLLLQLHNRRLDRLLRGSATDNREVAGKAVDACLQLDEAVSGILQSGKDSNGHLRGKGFGEAVVKVLQFVGSSTKE